MGRPLLAGLLGTMRALFSRRVLQLFSRSFFFLRFWLWSTLVVELLCEVCHGRLELGGFGFLEEERLLVPAGLGQHPGVNSHLGNRVHGLLEVVLLSRKVQVLPFSCQGQELGRDHLGRLVERVHQLVLVALEVLLNHLGVGEVPDGVRTPILHLLEGREHLFVREALPGAELFVGGGGGLAAHVGRGHHNYQGVGHRGVEQKSILHQTLSWQVQGVLASVRQRGGAPAS